MKITSACESLPRYLLTAAELFRQSDAFCAEIKIMFKFNSPFLCDNRVAGVSSALGENNSPEWSQNVFPKRSLCGQFAIDLAD